jgi:hypothetical protein
MQKHVAGISVVVVVALTLLSGVIQGTLRHRWGVSPELASVAERLKQVPTEFGRWKLAKVKRTEDMPGMQLDMLEAASYTVRDYHSDELREDVVVSVLLGPAGPIAAHRPEVCLAGDGHKVRGDRKKVTLAAAAGSSDSFWEVTYQENGAEGRLRRIYYAWSNGGPWTAPDVARFAFAGDPYLYKVQVSSAVAGGAEVESNVCRQFLLEFLPKLKECLVQPEAN